MSYSHSSFITGDANSIVVNAGVFMPFMLSALTTKFSWLPDLAFAFSLMLSGLGIMSTLFTIGWKLNLWLTRRKERMAIKAKRKVLKEKRKYAKNN